MALPSQSHARTQSWRTTTGSGGGSASIADTLRRNKSVVIAGLAAAALVGGYVVYKARTPATTLASNGDTFIPQGQSPQAATAPLGQAPSAPAPAANSAPRPVNISMGALSEANAPRPSLDQLLSEAAQPKTEPASPVTPVAEGQPGTAHATTKPIPAVTDPTAQPASNPSAAPASAGDTARTLIEQANRLVQQNNPVEARRVLNDALFNPALTFEARGQVRSQIAQINQSLFFSPTPYKNDTVADEYSVVSGDSLARIVRRQGLPVDWRLLMRINKMPNENALRVGQRLKVVRQPLHAVVHKRDYRMDIYAGPPVTASSSSPGPDGQEAGWTYITSYRVGLGADNGTPEGLYVVRTNSKLINPRWVNPRTGEVFEADDPKNPIGEHWIGLDGADENTRRFAGYGIHGTIDPESVGQQKSMGCVRLLAPDIAAVYEMLVDKVSTVKVIP